MRFALFQTALLAVAISATEAFDETFAVSEYENNFAQTHSKVITEAETEVEADADAEVVGDGLTRVNMRDNKNNMLTVEIPDTEHKRVSYQNNTLRVEDDSDDSSDDDVRPVARGPIATPMRNVARGPISAPMRSAPAMRRPMGGPQGIMIRGSISVPRS